MTDVSFEEIQEEIYQYLLESEEPVYHGELEEQLGMSNREVGSALMSLYDDDRVDWPAPDQWVAVAENTMTIEYAYGEMRIEHE